MKDISYISHYDSPIGSITLSSDGENLTGLWFDGQKYFGSTLPLITKEKSLPIFGTVKLWLDTYFSGRVPSFTPPLNPYGTPFRKKVWKILSGIPYGEVITYKDITLKITASEGRRMSAQAVGGAVGHNPISIIIPCHRVIAVDGSLTGYAGGIERKEWLLDLERTAYSSRIR